MALLLNGEIDDNWVLKTHEYVSKWWETCSAGDTLHILLNTSGGRAISALGVASLLDEAQRAGANIHIHIAGACESAGWVVASAAQYVSCERYARLMTHRVMRKLDTWLDAEILEEEARDLRHTDEMVLRAITRRTRPEFRQHWEQQVRGGRDWRLDAESAKYYGLINEVRDA